MTSGTFRIAGERSVRRLRFGAMHLPTEPGPAREAAASLRLSDDQWRRLDRIQPR